MSSQVQNPVFQGLASPMRVNKTVRTTKTYTPLYNGPHFTLVVTEKIETHYAPVSGPAHHQAAPQARAVPVSRLNRGLSPVPASRSPSPVEPAQAPIVIPQNPFVAPLVPFVAPPVPLFAPRAVQGQLPLFVTDPSMVLELHEDEPEDEPEPVRELEDWEEEEEEMDIISEIEEEARAQREANLRVQMEYMREIMADRCCIGSDARGLHFLSLRGIRYYFKWEPVGPDSRPSGPAPTRKGLYNDEDGVYLRDPEGKEAWITVTERVCPQWKWVPESGMEDGEGDDDTDDDEEMCE